MLIFVFSLTNYSRLVMFSFGFQQAYQRGFEHGDEIFFSKVSLYHENGKFNTHPPRLFHSVWRLQRLWSSIS